MTREELIALAGELEGMDCREGCRTCPADGTKDSAYDLLPEEDRKAIEWVRKHGGLAAVEKRLMPEGMEWLLDVWPRWSNGEYCKFGDWWKAGEYGEREPQQLSRLTFFTPEKLREWGQDEGENFGYAWDCMRPSDTTYRPDKVEPPAPKVLDADGVEIRVGDVLYSIEIGDSVTVGNIEPGNPWFAAIDGALQHCAKFTHQRPVLDSDGVPIREGETVYVLGFGEPLTVKGFTDDGRVLMSFHDENSLGYKPSKLTHKRPVLDADGVEIRVGDTVCGTQDMEPMRVVDTDSREYGFKRIKCEKEGEGSFFYCEDELTHKLPVLAADGKPLREGEAVWSVYSGTRYTVEKITDGPIPIKCRSEMGSTVSLHPSQLAHTNPEPPDTYAKLYEDVHDERCGSEEFVRRCRALAERGV